MAAGGGGGGILVQAGDIRHQRLDVIIRQIERELEQLIVTHVVEAADRLQAVAVVAHFHQPALGDALKVVRAFAPAQDVAQVGIVAVVQRVEHRIDIRTRERAAEQLFVTVDDPRAVLRHKGDLAGDIGEEGFQLVILVAAGDDELDAALLHLLIAGLETRPVVLFFVVEEGAVFIYRHHFYHGHHDSLTFCRGKGLQRG